MITHVLLFGPVLHATSSSAHQKTVEKTLSFSRLNMIFDDNRDFAAPNKRYSSVIQVAEAVCIMKIVLDKNDMLSFLSKQPKVNAPTCNWNIDIHSAAEAFANARVGPVNLNKIAHTQLFDFVISFPFQTSKTPTSELPFSSCSAKSFPSSQHGFQQPYSRLQE
jgi:hypothetical protein